MRASSDLLIACARHCLGLDAPAALAERLVADCDWTATVQLALRHHVSPLLARAAATLPADALPDGLALALALHDTDNRSRSDDLLRALRELLDGLAARGVCALPFKGPVLGGLAYGDPSLRRAGDLDILVQRADLDTTCRYLRALGFAEATELELGRPVTASEDRAYRRFQCEYQFIHQGRGLVVEPHWAFARPALAIDLDHDGFWNRLRLVVVGDRPVWTLSAEDTFLAVGIHAAKHGWARLQWLCDTAALLIRDGDLDVEVALARGRAAGVERILLIGIRLAEVVLGLTPPPAARRRLEADPTARAYAADTAARLFLPETTLGTPGHRLPLRLRERWRDRARSLLRSLVTPQLHHLPLLPRPDLTFPLLLPAELLHRHGLLPLRRAVRSLTAPLRRGWHSRRPRRGVRRILLIAPMPNPRDTAAARLGGALLRLLAAGRYRLTHLGWHSPLAHPTPQPPFSSGRVEVVTYAGPEDLVPVLRRRLVEFDVVLAVDAVGVELLAHTAPRGGTRRPRILLLPTGRDSEESTCRARMADAVLASSAGSYSRVRARVPHLPIHLVPYPVGATADTKDFDERHGLLFVGHLAEDGSPDTLALISFLDQVWPTLRRRLGESDRPLALDIVGPLGALSLAVRQDTGVRWLGAVGDLSAACAGVRIAVAPFLSAPSDPHALLEIAGRGVPLVASRVVAAELGWEEGTDIMVPENDDPLVFAETVLTTYTTRAIWRRVRDGGLGRILRDHAPEQARCRLDSVLRQVVRQRSDASPAASPARAESSSFSS